MVIASPTTTATPAAVARKSKRPNKGSSLSALSLFSGAGGMDIGIIQAGFQIKACIEIDEHCCSTLQAAVERENRDTLVIHSDVRKIDPRNLMDSLGMAAGELDLLCGGPPCQTFSQIGKQEGIHDERGLLLFEMPRFAEVFEPKTILIENVSGLLSARDNTGRRGGVLQGLVSALEKLGYNVHWQLINAAAYGVPQLRQRVFIVATKKPLGKFQFPSPTHGPVEGNQLLFTVKPYVGVGEVLTGLGCPAPKAEPTEDSHVDVTPAGDKRRIHDVPEGSFLAAQTHLPKDIVGNLSKKDTTKFLRLSRNKPANTLRCGEIFFHPVEHRYLTPREYMRIHGYPDDYQLKGPIRGRSGQVKNLDQHRQVANSVPPPVARILGSEIRKAIECPNYSKSLAIM